MPTRRIGLALLPLLASALDNGLARNPPRGFNPWNVFGHNARGECKLSSKTAWPKPCVRASRRRRRWSWWSSTISSASFTLTPIALKLTRARSSKSFPKRLTVRVGEMSSAHANSGGIGSRRTRSGSQAIAARRKRYDVWPLCTPLSTMADGFSVRTRHHMINEWNIPLPKAFVLLFSDTLASKA